MGGNIYGGWVTYTAHLLKAFGQTGIKPKLYEVKEREERNTRPFGYGEYYRGITMEHALELCKTEVVLLSAVNKKQNPDATTLFNAGAYIVCHDPTDIRDMPDTLLENQERCIVIRKEMLEHLPNAKFIPHPYVRVLSNTNQDTSLRPNLCTSTSRIDFDKYTEIPVEANRLLPEHKHVKIMGFENRIYSKKHLVADYPEWEQSKVKYSRTEGFAVYELSKATFMLDLSDIKGEGGGTQYTTLEAWDAGAVCILNRNWMKPGGQLVDGVNCFTIEGSEETGYCEGRLNQMPISGKELADFLDRYDSDEDLQAKVREMQTAGYKELDKHSAEVIAPQYKDWLK